MNLTRNLVSVVTGFLVMISLQGCSTIAMHTTEPTVGTLKWVEPNEHYAGFRSDIGSLNDGLFGNVYDLEALCTPIYLVDLPLSGVADTILFPFDRVQNPVTNAPPKAATESTGK
jgi:uncharacterized protein YceK